MKLDAVKRELENVIPLELAEDWDNVGLLTAPTYEKDIGTIIFTIDLTEKVLNESIACGADMIISYHPPIFSPLKSLQNSKWKDKIILNCIERGIAVYSPHTALDAIEDGVNDWMLSCFEISTSKPLHQYIDKKERSSYEITCQVPPEQDLKKVLSIPDVQMSVLSSDEQGKRLNISIPESHLMELLSLLPKNHSNMILCKSQSFPRLGCGMGRICELVKPVTLKDAVKLVKRHFGLSHLRVSFGKEHTFDSEVSTIAVCAGSGGQVLSNAAADLYITGEMSHHDLLNAGHLGVTVFLCEHSNSERGFLQKLIKNLEEKLSGVKLILASSDKDPINIF